MRHPGACSEAPAHKNKTKSGGPYDTHGFAIPAMSAIVPAFGNLSAAVV